jgi:pimeloyl-ACP methyl ester carboxylesterase
MPHFAAAQIECHAVSLRGSEGSPSDAATVRTAEHVADLAAFVEEHLRRPPVMVGHSYGGAFLLKYLEQVNLTVTLALALALDLAVFLSLSLSPTSSRAARRRVRRCSARCRPRATGR